MGIFTFISRIFDYYVVYMSNDLCRASQGLTIYIISREYFVL